MQKTKWFHGQRGEWYVAMQAVLLALLVLGPNAWPGAAPWTPPFNWLSQLFGSLLMAAGLAFCLMAIFHLGDNLTPLPHPKDDANLIVSGPYRLVRHPIYSGIIFAAFGFALLLNGWLTLGYATILLIFFDIKSRREEVWLTAKFTDYPAYQQRVHKLIPLIY